MKVVELEYKAWAARQGCVVTAGPKVELHHVQGVRSPKTGLPLPKRNGIANLVVIPLVPRLHRDSPDAIETIGEEEFGIRNLGGANGVLGTALMLLARFVLEECRTRGR